MNNRNEHEMPMFAYLILQYGGFELTIDSVLSILDVKRDEDQIVIVDNCSPDASYQIVREYFAARQDIHFLQTRNNAGFSAGNNLGYRYIKKAFNPDFIVVMNNDVEIIQSSFQETVERIFSETRFGVLGPDIYNPIESTHQNPFHIMSDALHPARTDLTTVIYARKEVDSQLRRVNSPYLGIASKAKSITTHISGLSGLWRYRSDKRARENELAFQSLWNKRMVGVPLQGACLVMSKLFVRQMPQAFYPETFLYCEEMILQLNCQVSGLSMVYDPELKVIHREGSTTLRQEGDLIRQEATRYNNIYKSLQVVEDFVRSLAANGMLTLNEDD